MLSVVTVGGVISFTVIFVRIVLLILFVLSLAIIVMFHKPGASPIVVISVVL